MAAPAPPVACGTCSLPIEAGQPTLKALGRDHHRDCVICHRCRAPPDGNFYEKDGNVYCRKDYFAMFGTQCNRCAQTINGKLMAFNNKFYHPDCFHCVACKKRIVAGEKCGLRNNDLYCEADWDPARAAAGAGNPPPSTAGYTPGRTPQQMLLDQQRRPIPTIAEPHDEGDRKRVRTKISEEQIAALERAFEQTPMPDGQLREQLANQLGLSLRVIQVWFQNRRAKEKKNRGGAAAHGGYDSVPGSPLPSSGQSTPRHSGAGAGPFPRRDLFAPRPNMHTMGGYLSSTNTTPSASPLVSPALSPQHNPFPLGDMPITHFESMTLEQPHLAARAPTSPHRSPVLRPQPIAALPQLARVHALESVGVRRSQSEPSLAELALGNPALDPMDDSLLFDTQMEEEAPDTHMAALLARGHPGQRPSISDTQAILDEVASAVRGGVGVDMVVADPASDLDAWLSDILMSTEAVVDSRVQEESNMLRSLGEADLAADPFLSVMADDEDFPRTVPGAVARAAIDPPLSAVPDRILGEGGGGGLRRVKSAPLFPHKNRGGARGSLSQDKTSPLKAQHASMKRRSNPPMGLKRNESLDGRLSNVSSRSSVASALRRSRSHEFLADSRGNSDLSGQESDDSMLLDQPGLDLNVTL
eukprot:Opistho-1_new@66751